MALEEAPDLIGALIGPTEVTSEVVRNLSGRNLVRQRRNCRENPAGVLAKFRNETVGKQHGHDDDCEIGFQNVWPSQVSEKQRVALQEHTSELQSHLNLV